MEGIFSTHFFLDMPNHPMPNSKQHRNKEVIEQSCCKELSLVEESNQDDGHYGSGEVLMEVLALFCLTCTQGKWLLQNLSLFFCKNFAPDDA